MTFSVFGLRLPAALAFAMSGKRSTSPEDVIAAPVNLQAKPTCYKPAPNNPPRGKRRRQWR